MIQTMARTGLPTVISAGMATLAEIEDAVNAFRSAGGKELILLHCVSTYPTPAEDVHLRKMQTLAAKFDCPVGFSDHTWGNDAALGAVALGACMIEKHFTLDKNLPGPDHRFSADPIEFQTLVRAVRALEKDPKAVACTWQKCLGEAEIGPAVSEAASRQDFKLSCVAVKDLPSGHPLNDSDITFCRPGTGLPPKAALSLVGKRLARPVRKEHVFSMKDFS